MEYSIKMNDIDDARDMFLLAKDRLLDINDWDCLFAGSEYSITLTNSKGAKLHRDARVNDLVNIAAANNMGNSSEMWIRIKAIQYDFFPDVRSESISILFCLSFSPSGNGVETASAAEETIIIKREYDTIIAHCNTGNELPDPYADIPNELANNDIELHPVLSIPQTHLQQLLQGFIAIHEQA
ncbi:MAG: hypothetical protein KDC07_00535 [Chitinophagaceae bacterium]|nr:hypothetical protein [Chitinophagaceae bacterium]MCB9046209.1 hypothetical protein [Chitinophagales bacterium]